MRWILMTLLFFIALPFILFAGFTALGLWIVFACCAFLFKIIFIPFTLLLSILAIPFKIAFHIISFIFKIFLFFIFLMFAFALAGCSLLVFA